MDAFVADRFARIPEEHFDFDGRCRDRSIFYGNYYSVVSDNVPIPWA
jgi:hypothetical protein